MGTFIKKCHMPMRYNNNNNDDIMKYDIMKCDIMKYHEI